MKRLLALLLCLVMALSLIPASAAEDIEIVDVEEDEITIVEPELDPGEEKLAAKPSITVQPKNKTAYVGSTAKFTVKADNATAYQWYWRRGSTGSWAKSTLSGNKTATLSVTAKSSRSGFEYRCRVSNSSGYVYSKAATLTVTDKPVITTQPKSVTAVEGTTTEFAVKAAGATKYQWYWRASSSDSWQKSTQSGNATSELSVKATAARSGFQYKCRVSNSKGYVYTKIVTLTVRHGDPMVTKQPKSVTVDEGGSASFTVRAVGGGLSYQWYWYKKSTGEWVKCTDKSATTATLSYTKISHSWDGYKFCCLISNDVNVVWTVDVTLTVVNWIPPKITSQPKDVSINEGETASFSVRTRYADSYQWYWWKESSSEWLQLSASNAKTSTLTYTDVDRSWDGYQFRCKVTNSKGSVWTNPVTLSVSGRTAPVITSQPSSVTISEGESVSFTVKARHVEDYQWYWWKEDGNYWAKIPTASAKTATLKYSEVEYAWNGYKFACKMTNSAGYAWTYAVTLTVSGRTAPVIKTQPQNLTVESGFPASFSVKARYADSYQWEYRKNSSDSWRTIGSGTSATLSYSKAYADWNGYQFRCLVSNTKSSLYTNTVTLTVTAANVSYRALLVGECDFKGDTHDLPYNTINVSRMANMLQSVTGPAGGSYTVTSKIDLSKAQLTSAISSTFAKADANDVSLFYIATHGLSSYSSGEKAGRLVLIGSDVADEHITLGELAECLKNVPGTVIVILNSCGSGAAIYEGNGTGSGAETAFDAAAFNAAAIGAFAAQDPIPNIGEFRTSKFYVLTAAAHNENSWGSDARGSDFTYYLCQGVVENRAADANNDGIFTLKELYSFTYDKVLALWPVYDEETGTDIYQHVQVYPENSNYSVFK